MNERLDRLRRKASEPRPGWGSSKVSKAIKRGERPSTREQSRGGGGRARKSNRRPPRARWPEAIQIEAMRRLAYISTVPRVAEAMGIPARTVQAWTKRHAALLNRLHGQRRRRARERWLESLSPAEGGRHPPISAQRRTCAPARASWGLAERDPPQSSPPDRVSRPECGARTRVDGHCRARVHWPRGAAEPKARCRLHGGLSTGPKTDEGKARIAASNRARHVAEPPK